MGIEAQSDPLLGSVFEGHYQVLELIGRGGMGNVYLAEETRLKRRCALKVLNAQLSEDRTHVERFLREARTMAQLSHSNIVNIHSFGEDPAGAFFVMELLEGEDLDNRLKGRSERPITLEDSYAWAIQIARAVGVVHKAKLIHRDLKTSNVFLAQQDGEEIVKLLDFGIARPVGNSELTKTGVALGTPSYMSPEQILNSNVDHRSDIYSFGVLLFKLFTGRLPFAGEPIQVTMQHCMTPPPRPSEVAPEANISPALESLILRAMAKTADERFQSMLEIEHALVSAFRNDGSEAAFEQQSGRPVTLWKVPLAAAGTGRQRALAGAGLTPSQGQPSADWATPGGHGPPTGPTVAIPVPTAQPNIPRALYVITAVSAISIFLVLVMVIQTKLAGPAPAPEAAPTQATLPAALPAPAAPTPTPESPAQPPPQPALSPDPAPTNVATDTDPAIDTATASDTTIEPVDPTDPTDPTDLADLAEPVIPSSKPTPTKSTVLLDPIKQIQLKATACRRKHKLLDGPRITVGYAVSIAGKVTRSIPSSHDPLGKCLADVVLQTKFKPELLLGQKITL